MPKKKEEKVEKNENLNENMSQTGNFMNDLAGLLSKI